jgi:hypothetical protein
MLSDTGYSAFGLTVASTVPLPDLPAEPLRSVPDVSVSEGRVESEEGAPLPLSGDRSRAVLTVPDVARYEIFAGNRIVVDACPKADERHVRLFLLGSAFGALLHQRGLLPLHANAVELDGRAVAFAGPSGAGKSTLAAWFHDRGHPILTDDVCVVRWGPGGEPVASPGIPRLRLWRDALKRTGRRAEDFDQTWPNDEAYDKFDVPLPTPADRRRPLPLAAIYLLREGDGPLALERLRGSAAVGALISNTYRGNFVQIVGDPVAHWRQCHALATTVPIFEAVRSFDPERFEQEALMIEDHSRGQVAVSRSIAASRPKSCATD